MIRAIIPRNPEFDLYKDKLKEMYEQNQDKICDTNSFNFIIHNTLFYCFIGNDGALIGAIYTGVVAYDNGSREWNLVGWIFLGGFFGGVIGGIVGYYAWPMMPSLFASGGGLTFAAEIGFNIFAITGSSAGAAATTSAIALASAGLIASGVITMFSKGNGPRMGHNQYEKKQIDYLCRKYQLSKEQRRILHEHISGRNYSYHEIEKIIIELFFS